MNLRHLAIGAALAALLAACGQKQSSTAAAPQTATQTAQTQSAAPVPSPSSDATTASAPAAEASAATLPRFDSKTGRVEFTLSGMQTGT
ncbi:MAG TPA: hypothetical protein VEH07_03420, partial [Alphaproteobacteria bacterium]|nr:hypothetical protein [Alphaproteobacteria bacterium]